MKDQVASAIERGLSSPNCSDSNGEVANVVDGLYYIARALKWLGNADADTPHGALEAHCRAIAEAGRSIASALLEVADAIRAGKAEDA